MYGYEWRSAAVPPAANKGSGFQTVPDAGRGRSQKTLTVRALTLSKRSPTESSRVVPMMWCPPHTHSKIETCHLYTQTHIILAPPRIAPHLVKALANRVVKSGADDAVPPNALGEYQHVVAAGHQQQKRREGRGLRI